MSYKSDLEELEQQAALEPLIGEIEDYGRMWPNIPLGHMLMCALPPGENMSTVQNTTLLAYLRVFNDFRDDVKQSMRRHEQDEEEYLAGLGVQYCTKWPYLVAPLRNKLGKASGGRRRPRYCDQSLEEALPMPECDLYAEQENCKLDGAATARTQS